MSKRFCRLTREESFHGLSFGLHTPSLSFSRPDKLGETVPVSDNEEDPDVVSWSRLTSMVGVKAEWGRGPMGLEHS